MPFKTSIVPYRSSKGRTAIGSIGSLNEKPMKTVKRPNLVNNGKVPVQKVVDIRSPEKIVGLFGTSIQADVAREIVDVVRVKPTIAVADITSRIASKLKKRTTQTKKVITQKEIERVYKTLLLKKIIAEKKYNY